MFKLRQNLLALALTCSLPGLVFAQDTQTQPKTSVEQKQETPQPLPDDSVVDKLKDQVGDIGETIDQSETAQGVSAGVLQPIYDAAELIAFPAFYWVAFMLMVAGVISFAGQLIFAKLFLLFRAQLNLREVISDSAGLLISLIGLVLTTQAATQNSTFTESPTSVLSAAGVGVLVGIILLIWGQRLEFDAARGARATKEKAQEDSGRSRRTKM
ncbi:MAG: hypothetical protein ACR2NP_06565 [Pirellulaceae bacterium]